MRFDDGCVKLGAEGKHTEYLMKKNIILFAMVMWNGTADYWIRSNSLVCSGYQTERSCTSSL